MNSLPLNKIKQALLKIRNGDEKKLTDRYPSEVQPLASEINDLLEHNEKLLKEQERTLEIYVLKTPCCIF